MTKITFPCLFVGWLLPAAALVLTAPVELYVAPNRADTNPDTAEKSFRTLHRAQEAARWTVYDRALTAEEIRMLA